MREEVFENSCLTTDGGVDVNEDEVYTFESVAFAHSVPANPFTFGTLLTAQTSLRIRSFLFV